MRVSGDIGCRPRRVWAAGLMDAVARAHRPRHARRRALGPQRLGRGPAHARRRRPAGAGRRRPRPRGRSTSGSSTRIAALAGPPVGLGGRPRAAAPPRSAGPGSASRSSTGEAALGWPEAVPRIAAEGWERFAARAPADVVDARSRRCAATRRRCPTPSCATPQTFLHGDWKFGNLGTARRRPGDPARLGLPRPGAGRPRAGLVPRPQPGPAARSGHTKESTIDDLRAALERHGRGHRRAGGSASSSSACSARSVQFGWEKAYGDDDELGWWVDRCPRGAAPTVTVT